MHLVKLKGSPDDIKQLTADYQKLIERSVESRGKLNKVAAEIAATATIP